VNSTVTVRSVSGTTERTANYAERVHADWILVDDPRQVRHALNGREYPGTIRRSYCDVAAPLASWQHVPFPESDLPECAACHELVADAQRRGSRGARRQVPPPEHAHGG
jgi:hypothetical protein